MGGNKCQIWEESTSCKPNTRSLLKRLVSQNSPKAHLMNPSSNEKENLKLKSFLPPWWNFQQSLNLKLHMYANCGMNHQRYLFVHQHVPFQNVLIIQFLWKSRPPAAPSGGRMRLSFPPGCHQKQISKTHWTNGRKRILSLETFRMKTDVDKRRNESTVRADFSNSMCNLQNL